ncbi:uncharacterized protein LOC117189994 [Drosophila miranda]|uniref:uncharacterized protein LOC117189994 n=1 Tax=Drosophila miranda TaxID=7229 RepID=UPI00143F4A12|nr:uncharacterized protein LOC117189994 [Drosophila miranda]
MSSYLHFGKYSGIASCSSSDCLGHLFASLSPFLKSGTGLLESTTDTAHPLQLPVIKDLVSNLYVSPHPLFGRGPSFISSRASVPSADLPLSSCPIVRFPSNLDTLE